MQQTQAQSDELIFGNVRGAFKATDNHFRVVSNLTHLRRILKNPTSQIEGRLNLLLVLFIKTVTLNEVQN